MLEGLFGFLKKDKWQHTAPSEPHRKRRGSCYHNTPGAFGNMKQQPIYRPEKVSVVRARKAKRKADLNRIGGRYAYRDRRARDMYS